MAWWALGIDVEAPRRFAMAMFFWADVVVFALFSIACWAAAGDMNTSQLKFSFVLRSFYSVMTPILYFFVLRSATCRGLGFTKGYSMVVALTLFDAGVFFANNDLSSLKFVAAMGFICFFVLATQIFFVYLWTKDLEGDESSNQSPKSAADQSTPPVSSAPTFSSAPVSAPMSGPVAAPISSSGRVPSVAGNVPQAV